ncbi:hypothetical protein DUNSADRAFT_14767 [Dunaliella salina]|uniref:Uncharacterized protein n=1 Tax=Dunaliella salina TaxID=3046 RepID=A0ABQ7G6S6_DUNSA|nr:hypothetical protein DUNSADRAFT_14767 [Dunaliella salina]|eukprot:KAF5830313.1 hypothetical protein DUNSADRAFT_14767 [Dunaliella salina]
MDALQQRLLSGKESSTSFGSWPCRCSRRREGRQRYEQCQALPSLGKDRPAALLQAPIPATSISSAQQPSPPPVGFLRPVARNRVSEPFPLLPLHQHATDTSKAPSDSPMRSTSYKPLRASAPLITKRIKQTRTWYELEALVAEESRNFNHVHASAALLHLTKLLQGLAGGSAGHSPHSKSNDGSSMYSPSFSEATAGSRSTSTDLSLGDSHAQSLHTFVDTNSSQQQQQQQQRQILSPPPSEQQRQQQLQQQQQQQQETLLHGPPNPVSRSSRPTTSVDLAQQPPRVLALLHTLLRIVRREMPVMDVQGVSNTLYSLAVLRWPDMSLVEELMAAVQYRLDMSKPQNLANIIWSCVVLGYMPEQDWMVMYYRALDIRLHAFGPVDVSNTLWAFGRLQFDGKQYRVAPNVVRKLLQQAYSVLPHLEPQHMANTLWGLARLGFVPGPMWSQAFLNATGPKLLAMHAHELSSLAWAVGKLRMAPGPVWVSQLLLVSVQKVCVGGYWGGWGMSLGISC